MHRAAAASQGCATGPTGSARSVWLMSVRTPMTLASVEAEAGLRAAVALDPAGVIASVRESGMKGRGGAGFPTGLKWQLAAAAPAADGRRYVVCNADEGEPGTFKDRVLLAELADLVFEGMTIAGYAIGSTEGIVYLRGEYIYLLADLEECLARRRAAGLLGTGILGRPDFTFDIHVHLGSGAYVCGEETALIESLEGRRGEPRNRPPFPVISGLHGAPTTVNNVETFAWAAAILAKGAEWFAAIGTDRSTGPGHVAGDAQQLRPGRPIRPDGGEPVRTLGKGRGRPGEGLDVVHRGGRAVQAADHRERRTVARLTAAPFQALDQRRLLAADVRARAQVDVDVDG